MTEKVIQIETKINNVLFWICFFITILTIIMVLVEFFTNGEYPPSHIGVFYVGVLAIYSLHKEAIRFLEHASPSKKQRKGEIFVYFWIILTAILYLINFLTKNSFSYTRYGEETRGLMDATYLTLEVGIVFILARILKLVMIKFFYKNEKQ
jgi:cytosine/uracil/thiamine/allantoin permease